ncbi:Inosamine-phosphate amidinotransferase 1 [Planctomycetes bacterium CA13]|uniref:Inosamine-phosphate amidinotransferase 1 n=1 Tax=Novipirellula herctigrandis TaxID=2527986 RepID=A0A5C5Z2N4_9BACT|nr:Inosamine-phosphate amidinotransferase 1 [Planctomycetes bacterium CA13]
MKDPIQPVRRDFMKTAAAAASAVALTGVTSTAHGADQKKGTKSKMIQVNHEWGALKEVVVGVPNLRLPSKLAEAPKQFLPDTSIEFIEKHAGKLVKDCAPDLFSQFVEQVNGIIQILEDRGIIVHQVKKHLPSEEAFLAELNDTVMQTYPRDPMLVIGNKFIETAMYEPNRRKERFAIRRTIGDRLANSNARIVSMPEPEPFPADENGKYGPGPFLEGGDVMLVGRDIYVGNTGNASNKAGMRWLQNCLGNKYRVHEVPLSSHFLHLDCVLALVRPGLAVICKEAFIKGIPDFLKDWKLIDVSAEDAEQKLGCNGLVLDENTMIVGDDMPELAESLSAEGTEVLTARIDGIYWQGGGFRCWHHPLVRESKLA